MGDDIYVRAAVTSGGKTYLSDMCKYSVLQYAYTAQQQSNTLKKLLSDMLSYGASAQAHFKYNTARPVNGTWYSITVENGSLADGAAHGLYLSQDSITMTAAAAPAGKTFSHWQDATGANVSTEATYTTTISASTTYTAIYVDEGAGGEVVLNKLAYTVNADGTTCTVTGLGTCAGPVINVPAEIDGYTVTAIGEKAFAEQPTLTAINLPETVKTIGTRAFYASTGLTEMTIPASVTEIGTQIFYKCNNLKTVYDNSTYYSEDNPFLNIANIEKVVFGGKYVPAYICQNFTNIKTVEIKDSVTSIQYSAFYGCTSLVSINIPDSVTSIGGWAFNNCTSLKAVYITNMEAWLAIDFYDSYSTPCRNGADLYLNNVLVTEVTIPNTMSSIGYAFTGCTSLTSITIPDSVTSIGGAAFSDCTSLASITIPDSVTSIGDLAFYGCTSLTSITIPDSVTSIGSWTFSDCTRLTSITIPDSVTSIDDLAFLNCTSLTTVYYTGTPEEWRQISIGSSNSRLPYATRYYYSETQPTDTTYQYWHYVNGVPTKW